MHELTVSVGGAVSGSVRMWLRAEAFSVLAMSLLLYSMSGLSWWIFFVLLLVPDVALLAYLISPKVGGASYNLVHSYFLPISLAMAVVVLGDVTFLPYIYIWMAHIGMDRLLGYGLKYPMAANQTHLGDLAGGPGKLVKAVGL